MFYCSILLYNFYNFLFSFNSGVIWSMNVRFLLNQIILVGTLVPEFQSTWKFILVAFSVSFSFVVFFLLSWITVIIYYLFLLCSGIFSYEHIASFSYAFSKYQILLVVTRTYVILKGGLKKTFGLTSYM